MSKIQEVANIVSAGRAKLAAGAVQAALDEGCEAAEILNAMIDAMGVVGERFKNNEIFVPEVLVAARAMNVGAELLKPYLSEAGVEPKGKVILGTVKGDLHDIGKNLVRMMLEGKGLTVIDLGVDVPPEKFVEAAIENDCSIICCSALLTTTMPVMGEVVEKAVEAGVRDKVKIMIGGAPVTEAFGQSINADAYTPDATTCAEVAMQLLAS